MAFSEYMNFIIINNTEKNGKNVNIIFQIIEQAFLVFYFSQNLEFWFVMNKGLFFVFLQTFSQIDFFKSEFCL